MISISSSRRLTDGTKVPHKQGLLPILNDSGHKLVCQKDGRNTAENQNQETKSHEPGNSDSRHIGEVKFTPRDNCPNVHESAKVQKHVDAGVNFVMPCFCFFKVLPIPIECVAGHETSQ